MGDDGFGWTESDVDLASGELRCWRDAVVVRSRGDDLYVETCGSVVGMGQREEDRGVIRVGSPVEGDPKVLHGITS